MRKLLKYEDNSPIFFGYSAVGGYEEKKGPFGEKFDFCDESDYFGMKTFESAEGEMGRICLNLAFSKCGISPQTMEVMFAGDLQDQCVASSGGLYSFGIPYIGLYSACSTCTEALFLLSSSIAAGYYGRGCAVTTSHNGSAERQFRSPVEYGGQRSPSASWTATAAGSFILYHPKLYEKAVCSSEKSFSKNETCRRVKITEGMAGKIVDGLTPDSSNMGAAMARAAFDTVYTYFELSGELVGNFDLIVTGDLGRVGSSILKELLSKNIPGAESRHTDCGCLIYGEGGDSHAGGSGCGCSASLLAAHFLPLLSSGKLKNILFLSTGALMSKKSILQGGSILGIAPLIRISSV